MSETPQQKQISISNLLIRLWGHLHRRRQLQFLFLMGLTLFSAFAEVFTIGAVLPFLGVLTAPELVFKYPLIVELASLLGIHSAQELVLPVTILFSIAALIAGFARVLLLWGNNRLAYISGADLSIDIYRRTLYQPYQVYVARNGSEIISGITNKVNSAVLVLLAFLTLVSSLVLLISILITLVIIDPMIALLSGIGFGGAYLVISLIARYKLQKNSHLIASKQTHVIKALQEGLGGIRDVLLDGTQETYCDIYHKADFPLRCAQGSNSFIGGSPRYAMEALGMILIASLAYLLSLRAGGVQLVLPVLGALALGAQRILPTLQNSHAAWANMIGNQYSLKDVIDMLDQPMPEKQEETRPIEFSEEVKFNSVYFRFNENGDWIINDLNITIPHGKRIGIVGSTGSGKSTMLDLFMGLLVPVEGEILVDGKLITNEYVQSWKQSIAHVPQAIYLADTSIAENIAFGIPKDEIDYERLDNAVKQAQLAEFISGLQEGYDTQVGERGIRLSGGQRQRIGIARALYKNVSILVFDEATSALDNTTEQAIMSAIEGLNDDLTILIIAHRLTTVRSCDFIIELENGRVVGQGAYEDLIASSPSFSKMAKIVS